MHTHKNSRLLGFVMAVLLSIGAFCAWMVHADGTSGTTQTTPTLPSPTAIASAVETHLNEAIQGDLFGQKKMATGDELVTQHLSSFCASEVEQGGNCPTDPALLFGDLKLSSVLGPLLYDNDRRAAATAFLNTLMSPLDSSAVSNFQLNVPINAATLASNPSLKQQYAQALSDEAVLSIVRQSFAEMVANRTATGSDTGSTSVMQIMANNATQYFMNPDWAEKVAGLSGTDLQKQQLMLQGYQNWMSYQRYRQTERVEALLAMNVLLQRQSQKNSMSTLNSASAPPAALSEPVADSGGE